MSVTAIVRREMQYLDSVIDDRLRAGVFAARFGDLDIAETAETAYLSRRRDELG
jgi:hypothetical protein